MASDKTLVVVGSANMDLVVSSKRFPRPGETVLGKELLMFPGGKGANQAVCAAKLGGNVAFIGKMGSDIFRDRLYKSMHHDGVNVDHILMDETVATGVALIIVDDAGGNEIVVVPGSNMKLSPANVGAKKDLIGGARAVLLQLEIPIETVIETAEIAAEGGAIVILNPAPARKLPKRLLEKLDYIIPNETEAELLTGIPVKSIASAKRAGRKLLEHGVKNVIITLGDKGSVFIHEDAAELFESVRVKAVDTTAAGDAFNGAFAYSLVNGMTVGEAIRLANTVAALSVTQMGAQSSMPTMRELDTFTMVDAS